MNGTKAWYASSGVWGGIVAVAAPLAAVALHVTISDADAQTIAQALSAGGAAVGGLIAIIGRIRATKVIARTPTP